MRVWDVGAGQELLVLTGREEGVAFGVSFSPDGERLAVAFEGAVEVWDAVGSPAVEMDPGWHLAQAARLMDKGRTADALPHLDQLLRGAGARDGSV